LLVRTQSLQETPPMTVENTNRHHYIFLILVTRRELITPLDQGKGCIALRVVPSFELSYSHFRLGCDRWNGRLLQSLSMEGNAMQEGFQ